MTKQIPQKKPVVDLGHSGTKVNLWMVIGVALFFVAMAVILWLVWRDPPHSTNDMRLTP
jgi:hypothetical protein